MITSIKLKGKIEYQIALRNSNMTLISDIPTNFMNEIDIKLNDIPTISMRIPKKVPLNGKMIDYPIYNEIADEKLITVNDKYCFYILNITDVEDGNNVYKEFTAYSMEKKLEKRTVDIAENTYRLKSNDNTKDNSIFDILENETRWKLGYIDDKVLRETKDDGSIDYKYRYFEASEKNWASFLKDEISKTYNAQLFFNSFTKTIDVYDKDDFGEHKGLYLSNENFIKNVKKSVQSEQVVTRLKVTGKDDLTINEVNMGLGYIEDYSYYISNGLMSNELIESLVEYKSILEKKKTEWETYNTNLTSYRSDYGTKNTTLTSKKEELKAKEALKIAYQNSKDEDSLTKVNVEIDTLNNEITSLTNETDKLNTQIKNTENTIADLVNFVKKENITDLNDNKLFDDDMLSELDNFTYEESWSDENCTTTKDLLENGSKEMNDRNTPPIENDLELVDFLSSIRHPQGWDYILTIGDYVTIDSKINNKIDFRFIGYKHSPNDNKLSIYLSNKEFKLKGLTPLAKLVKKHNKDIKNIKNYKSTWKKSLTSNSYIDDIQTNGIDLSRNIVIGESETNKTEFTDKGIFTTDTLNNNKKQIYFGGGVITATNDGWNSSKKLLDADGIYGNGLIENSVDKTKLTEDIQDILSDILNTRANKITLEEKIEDIVKTTNEQTYTGTTYVHTQTSPSNIWIINHGLNRFPKITVVDSGNNEVKGETQYLSENIVQLTFQGGFSGIAYLN